MVSGLLSRLALRRRSVDLSGEVVHMGISRCVISNNGDDPVRKPVRSFSRAFGGGGSCRYVGRWR